MRPKAVEKTLISLVKAKLPIFVWGAPGIGKSSIVKQVAKVLELDFLDLRLTLLDPTDLKGIPFLQDNQAVWASASFLPKDGGRGGILFLDELNAAAPSVQAAAYQLILDRKVGEYTLPDNWAIVAAGNRDTDRGVTHKIPTPLANRFVHLDMEVDFENWRVWAYDKGINAFIIAYVSQRPEALFIFDPTSKQKSFATPRSWEFVHTILESDLAVEHHFDAISGAIGREVAAEFIEFTLAIDELPDITRIFEGSVTFYPSSTHALHVLSSQLIYYALRKKDKQELNHLLRYTLELEPEFAILIVRTLQAQGVLFDRLEAWRPWVQKYSYLLA